jgi:hypothetical protein
VPNEQHAHEMLSSRTARLMAGQVISEGHILVQKQNPAAGSASILTINEDGILAQLKLASQQAGSNVEQWPGLFSQFLTLFAIALDGKNRSARTKGWRFVLACH